ncbi:serine/threonine-protein kinase pim-2-like isoform X2 [Ictalurus furcatus]|uniref:serine/threonine-protein kinase pim-2-like isoform X2 n=1 Tax=Ictalurus furcatus TaxID=66913 RepID=UPI0023510096|nr:serine/threonine-protein kinase pim-2-like isoform X2 [Ictalurus furcatus]
MENTVGLLTDLFSAKKMDCKCPAKADMLLTETSVETPCAFTRRQSKNPLKRKSMDVLHDGPEPQPQETPGKRRRTKTEENDSKAPRSFNGAESMENPLKRKRMAFSHEGHVPQTEETPGKIRRTETEEDVNREKTENDSEASYSFAGRQSEVNPRKSKRMAVSHEEPELRPVETPGKRRRTEAEEKDVNREKTENDSEASYSFAGRQSEVNPQKRKRMAVSHEEPELLPEGTPGKRRRTETEENHEKSEKTEKDSESSYSFVRSQSKTNPLTEENQEKTGTQPVRRINPFREAKFHGRYLLGELLGQGGFGAVYAGIRKSDGQKVAVKIAFKQEDEPFTTLPGETRRLPLEVALMELVCKPPRCPHVIELLEWFETPTFFILVLERPDRCVNLYKYCSSLSDAVSESQVKTIMEQIIWAAIHCSKRGVIHRDIKEENILINPKTLEVKLIDFGCGALLNDSHDIPFAGTTLFLPPELIVKGEYEAEPVTVWGLGILIYSLLCGQEPIYDHHNIGEGDMYIPSELSEASCKLINWCLQCDPERRPSLQEVISDDWFTTPEEA